MLVSVEGGRGGVYGYWQEIGTGRQTDISCVNSATSHKLLIVVDAPRVESPKYKEAAGEAEKEKIKGQRLEKVLMLLTNIVHDMV